MTDESERTSYLSPDRRQYLKRQANHIVSQLPENEAEALFVLELAKRLVVQFLAESDGASGIEIVKKTS